MAQKIERSEDLIVWQKSRQLTRRIYEVTQTEPFGRDHGLRDQMQRSAVSVMSNIAEGYKQGSSAEFYRYLLIAKASCGELRSQLYVAADTGYIPPEQFQNLLAEAVELSRIISGLALSIRNRR